MILTEKIQSLITAANNVTGGSDTSLTDAVQTLCDGYGSGGGGAVLTIDTASKGVSDGIWHGVDTLYMSLRQAASNLFLNTSGIRKFILSTANQNNFLKDFYIDPKDYTLQEIEIIGNTASIHQFSFCFSGRAGLKRIIGVLDFSASILNDMVFENCTALEDVEIQPESIKKATGNNINAHMFPHQMPHLTDASFVSIANGLETQPSGSTKTCKFISYDLYKNIMGDIVNGIFVADPNGSTAVSSFISAKGWTITT